MTVARTVRIAVAPSLTLEARLHDRAASVAVIAPPHPVYGGSIGNPVVRAVEAALLGAGFATLAFNWRGVGDSDGDASEDRDEALADYLAAARSLAGRELAWAAGYSFGAATALSAALRLDAPRALLIAPPMSMLNHDDLAAYRGELTVIAGAEDEYAPPDALREAFKREPPTELHILDGVEHFFHGSGAKRLEQALAERLAAHKKA